MEFTADFFRTILDSVTEQLAVIDKDGNIVFVNDSWQRFSQNNGQCDADYLTSNYLKICKSAADHGDYDALNVLKGLNQILNGEITAFRHEYPCHSPKEQRWFMMSAVHFSLHEHAYIVITHQDITLRKLAEEKAAQLSVQDALTGIPNRRKFNDHIAEYWRELARYQECMSLAFIDIDNFKTVNDSYGHAAGDEVLKKIAEIINSFARRPADICARYGGDEFVLLLSHTSPHVAKRLLQKLQRHVRAESFFTWQPAVKHQVTVSIGLVSTVPVAGVDIFSFIEAADRLLYQSKKKGRDRVIAKEVVMQQKDRIKLKDE